MTPERSKLSILWHRSGVRRRRIVLGLVACVGVAGASLLVLRETRQHDPDASSAAFCERGAVRVSNAGRGRPIVSGFYTTPVRASFVPNLRRGEVVITYGHPLPAQMLDALQRWWSADSERVLVVPKLGSQAITLAGRASQPGNRTAFEYATCTGFDAAAFTKFVREHRQV